jgi:hypothetical protein
VKPFKPVLRPASILVHVDTFIVRVFPVEVTEPPGLRGIVSRVASGDSRTFHTVDELVAFLADPRGGQGIGESPASSVT